MQPDSEYEAKIHALESETARCSEQSLLDQEQRALASLREITQSVEAMDRDNTLVQLQRPSSPQATASEQVVDPGCLHEKIGTFAQLVELLKLTHLEQETLDYFLRYTISSSNLLQLESVQDAKYVQLQRQVQLLEEDALQNHLREIENTKGEIAGLCRQLTKTQDTINETHLDTTRALDDCQAVLDELDQLRGEKQTSEEADTVEDDPVAQSYEDWQLLRQAQAELAALDGEAVRLQSISQSYESLQSRDDDPALLQTHGALELLTKLWQAKFLPRSTMSDLQLFPQTRKFQFDVEGAFTVVVSLGGTQRLAIKDIQIHTKRNCNGGSVDQSTTTGLTDRYRGTRDIYNALDDIIHTLRRLATREK